MKLDLSLGNSGNAEKSRWAGYYYLESSFVFSFIHPKFSQLTCVLFFLCARHCIALRLSRNSQTLPGLPGGHGLLDMAVKVKQNSKRM